MPNSNPSDAEERVAPFKIHDVLTRATFPHPVVRLEMQETHISWVILTGDFAYKIKKSVRFDFLDTTRLGDRQFLCEEEVRLNRRTAPDIYLGVVPITRDNEGFHFAGSGATVEYAVKMRQFDRSQELLTLLSNGTVTLDEVAALGERLARFHFAAAVAEASKDFVYTEHQCESARSNLAYFLSRERIIDDLPELRRLIDWTQARLPSFRDESRRREEVGKIRECHGDLHARNIVRWQDQLIPFDCLEFNPDFRWIDVMNDIAFLAMDLVDHRRSDLECAFLDRYLETTGDYEGLALLPFYAVYRALVRAKVDAISFEQQPAQQTEYRDRLRSRIATAHEFANPAPPMLMIMHGPSGSGKSWLSERLVAALPAIRIRSDLERKRIAGIDALAHREEAFQSGIYSPEFTHRTYEHLVECAQSSLRGGLNTIVDAAFLNIVEREMFRTLAAKLGHQFIIIDCQAERSVLSDRVMRRSRERTDPSDADVAVLQRQLQNMKSLDATEEPYVVSVSTDRDDPVPSVVNALRNYGRLFVE